MSSTPDKLELIRQALEADRLHLQQVRKQVPNSCPPPSNKKELAGAVIKPSPRKLAAPPTNEDDQNSVFNRLYEISKRPRSMDSKLEDDKFRPQIDAKSRMIASRTDRGSLYERGKERSKRQEMRIERVEHNLQDIRNRSRLSHSTREMSFNPLRKEIDQRFGLETHVDDQGLHTVLQSLGIVIPHAEGSIFSRLAGQEGNLVSKEDLIDFLFQVFCSNNDDEFELKLKHCLVSVNQDIANNLRAQRAKQMQTQLLRKETPFRPKIAAKSQVLDEQRMEKLGIDLALPREEKLIRVNLKSKQDLQEAQKRWLEKQQAECTFKPQLCATFTPTASAAGGVAIAATRTMEETDDVANRLYQDSIRRRTRLQEKQTEHFAQTQLQQVAECTFQPVFVSRKHLRLAAASPAPPARATTTPMRSAPVSRFEERLLAESMTPPPPPPLPKPAAVALSSKVVVFQAEVDLPNGRSETVYVREGECTKDVAMAFAQAHDLDNSALEALANGLANALRVEEEEEEVLEQVEEEEDVDNELLEIDIVVREGETHSILVRMGQDPTEAARAFAMKHYMDRSSLVELVESLKQVVY